MEENIDPKLESAIEFSKYRETLQQHLEQLKFKVEQQLVVSENNGIFTVTTQLVSFLHMMKTTDAKSVVLMDDNETPIRISDIPAFLEKCINKYSLVMNYYYSEYEKSRKEQNAVSLFNLE